MRGLRVSIFRDAAIGDCTNGGVTSAQRGATEAILMGVPDGNYGEEDIREGDVVLEVVRRTFGGQEYVTCKPRGEKRWSMFGGNFVYSCDGRFRRAVCEYPIAVHDRIEG